MTQTSLFWNGISVGDADAWTRDGGYHMAQSDAESPWVDLFMRTLLNGTGNRGVLDGWLNELAVTGVATPLQVDTGAGIIYGLFYENDAALSVAVPSPTSDTRIDRIVVRRDWEAQTARVTRLVGLEGGVAPAITQSVASGIYDIPLAQISITTGGVITVTDEREFCTFCTIAGDNSINTGQIANEAVGWEQRTQAGKSIFYGGSDILALAGNFHYSDSSPSYFTGAVSAVWGSAAASMEGWQCAGTGTLNKRSFYVAFKPPADYVPGTTIYPYLWWIDDANASTGPGFSFYTAWQAYRNGLAPTFGTEVQSEIASYTQVVDTPRVSSEASPIVNLHGDELVLYCVVWYNAFGTDAYLMAGIEFAYTGYV